MQAEETISSVQTALSSTTLSGYVDTSMQWNFGTGDANVPNYAFGGPSKADGFNLNVVKVTLEKPIDPKGGWAAGYKVDLLYGPDANTLATQSTGVASDFAIKQAYVALQAPVGNGLTFKMGVWDTLMGYEVFESINNPNFTRSYGYTIEPTTHTGLNASYAFNDSISLTAGVANTFGPMINQRAFAPYGPDAESYKSYMGSLNLTAPKDWGFLAGSTLTVCAMNGYNSGAPGGSANQTSFYAGTVLNTPVKGLKVGASYDYVDVDGQSSNGDQATWANAAAGYVSYQLTEKLSLHVRGEYATSSQPIYLAEKVVAATATVQYDLWKNVVSRVEFRWDHAADGSKPYGGTVTGDGDLTNSYILMANFVYRF
jgi:hypothetical protein